MSLRQYPVALFVLGLIALSVAGCGRAGKLEAPPAKGAAAAQQQASDDIDEEEENRTIPSPVPTPQKQPKRPITVPNEPFFLDPIL